MILAPRSRAILQSTDTAPFEPPANARHLTERETQSTRDVPARNPVRREKDDPGTAGVAALGLISCHKSPQLFSFNGRQDDRFCPPHSHTHATDQLRLTRVQFTFA